MRELFKGWRPQTGVLTLVMVCVFAAGWIRTMVTADMFTLGRGNFDYEIVLNGGSLLLTTKKWQMSSAAPETHCSAIPPPGKQIVGLGPVERPRHGTGLAPFPEYRVLGAGESGRAHG